LNGRFTLFQFTPLIATFEALKKEAEKEKIDADRRLDEMKHKSENKEELVEQERMRILKLKKDTGLKSVLSQNGKHLAAKDLNVYLEKERQKEDEVIKFRIEFIKLSNQLKKKDDELKQREKIGETKLEVIDFEQLKIENQTYNEKIEERNEVC
jgi:hypothetical protein